MNKERTSLGLNLTLLECAAACLKARSGGGGCAAFQHQALPGGRDQCVLAVNALHGTDEVPGPRPRQGLTTCLRDKSAWLELGGLYNPEPLEVVSEGLATYTFHPEPLTWAQAEAACAADAAAVQQRRTMTLGAASPPPSAVGHLASVATELDLRQLLAVVSLMPPALASPGYEDPADFYGFWVGLAASSGDLMASLTAPQLCDRNVPASDASATRWSDGSACSAGAGACALQDAWGVFVDGSPVDVPPTGSRLCVHFSNSTSLIAPGLVAAGSCEWTLPFVCKSEFSPRTSRKARRRRCES